MWQDEILEEIHQIPEEHAKSFNYDFKAIFADWRKQAMNGRELVSLQPQPIFHDPFKPTIRK